MEYVIPVDIPGFVGKVNCVAAAAAENMVWEMTIIMFMDGWIWRNMLGKQWSVLLAMLCV